MHQCTQTTRETTARVAARVTPDVQSADFSSLFDDIVPVAGAAPDVALADSAADVALANSAADVALTDLEVALATSRHKACATRSPQVHAFMSHISKGEHPHA